MSRFDELFARYRMPLIRSLIAFGQSEQDAEDIVQETFFDTSKRLEKIAPEHEKAYLWVSAYNKAKTRARQSAKERDLVRPLDTTHDRTRDAAPNAEVAVIEQDESARFKRRFKAVMRRFPPETQQAIFLRSQGLSSRDIARKIELTDQAVRTRLSRAFEVIREQVGEPPSDLSWMSLPGDDDDHEE